MNAPAPAVPKASRLHIGLAGRTNAGKSTFLNLLAGQDVAITSATPGTTTDVVEKTMELLPLGPVTLIDTAGLDDASELGPARLKMTLKALQRVDVLAIIVTAAGWSDYEEALLRDAQGAALPVLVVINKTDLATPKPTFFALMELKHLPTVQGSAIGSGAAGEAFRAAFRDAVRGLQPKLFTAPPILLGDLMPAGGLAALVVPIDLGAPAGRLILPQVQSIRDLLDNDACAVVVKDREYAALLKRLVQPPDLVICDSQVVARVVADTPPDIKLTTFSILFARFKGDLNLLARGAGAIGRLKDGDKVLIAEGCSHHPVEDDIGRVKIPRWLKQFTGADLQIVQAAGHDFPPDLAAFQLVIHCGGCVMTRQEMMNRMVECGACAVPITNYGLAISTLQGVLARALSPFPDALAAFKAA
ncbi:MAG: [FeFe] hydrogenase H-cluster maturation GTPase HydF [Rhizomicrobium sp.]